MNHTDKINNTIKYIESELKELYIILYDDNTPINVFFDTKERIITLEKSLHSLKIKYM